MKAKKPAKRPPARKSTAKSKAKAPVRTRKSAAATVPAVLPLLVRALDEKKTEDLRVLRVDGLSSITDFLVIGTATSEPHQRALRVELEKVLDAAQAKILGIDSSKGSGWTVVDAFDVMIHLFTAENREKYRLDLLWKDAEEIPVSRLLVD